MAESVSILEGGIARKFYPVKKLRTSNGTGYDNWVPESEVETASLSVTERGVYYPANDGVYGYDEVDIDLEVADYTDGWDEDPETGEEKKEKVKTEKDPETGDDILVVTELPTSIRITTPPTTVNYVDGQDISIEGIVVTAYYADGREWGVVPFEELDFTPQIAEIGGTSGEYSDGNGVNAKRIEYTRLISPITDPPSYIWGYGGTLGHSGNYPASVGVRANDSSYDGSAALLLTKYRVSQNDQYYVYAKRIGGNCDRFDMITSESDGWYMRGGTDYRTTTSQFTRAQWEHIITDIPISTSDPTHAGSMSPSGGDNTVTVSWTPTAVDAPETEGLVNNTLTDTYDITVGQGPIPPNN